MTTVTQIPSLLELLAENTHLKAENEHLRACVNGRASNDAATVELLKAENERLKNSGLCMVEKCIDLEAENERLINQIKQGGSNVFR